MLIDEKITLKIASLAKLELTDQEIKEYSVCDSKTRRL